MTRLRLVVRCVLAIAFLSTGCRKVVDPNAPVTLQSGDLSVTMDPATGKFDVTRGGQLVFQQVTADVLFDAGKGPTSASFTSCTARSRGADGSFICTTSGMNLTLSLAVPASPPVAGQQFLTAQLTATNLTATPITVLRLAPLVADPSYGGSLWLGAQPGHHRIMENGQFQVLDQTAQLAVPTQDPNIAGMILPIPLRGNSVSNWSHIVSDLDTPNHSLVAGYLSFDHAVPTLGIAPAFNGKPDSSGRLPFTYAAESALIFAGKTLAIGESIESEVLYVEPLPADPIAALENYATELAAYKNITPWPKRGGGKVEPNGWNSWTGGGTGGYDTDINETLIKQSLAVFVKEFQPFGGAYFQVDDGYELAYGDWSWNPATFPDGAQGMESAIAATNLLPGLWVAPFSVASNSMTAQAHPDWLQPVEPSLALFGKNDQTLDLTNPAVQAHITQLFTGMKETGWKWAKCDFTYYDMLGRHLYDPAPTNIEAFSSGWQFIRDALGPDIFVVAIGIMGTNIGRVDAMRLTVDNAPTWDEQNADDALEAAGAFKATVRTGTHRWFYQNRVWVNHDDLIFFRANTDPGIPPLTFDESRAFASWIGLGGGIVKIGDKLLDMEQQPTWIDVIRRLLPAWPDGARPLDVLLRDYPEQYAQHISAPAGEWDVAGLINWGENRDWTTYPPTAMAETPRTYPLSCQSCLAYEFWSEQFLGQYSGSFTVTVNPREAEIIALRPVTGAPQFLGSNRHITQGANDMGPVTWNATSKTLSGSLLGAVGSDTAPFAYHLAFFAPPGFTLGSVSVEGTTATSTQTATPTGSVIDVRFSLPATAQGTMVPFSVVME